MKISEFKNKDEKGHNVMDTYNELKNLSHEQLSDRLAQEVKRQKDNGTFNYMQLLEMLEKIRPMLSSENYNNMKRMLDSLK